MAILAQYLLASLRALGRSQAAPLLYLRQNTLLANGDVNYDVESSSKMYAIFNCTTFKFSREMDRTKASLFSLASSDYKTPVHVTGT
jgi:hypothetical protein